MSEIICKRAVSISFWNGYAKWYHQWVKHNCYHEKILSFLKGIVKPGFRIIDVGAGSGVLSIPLVEMNCLVTALEPSLKMRELLYKEAFSKGIYWIKVDDRRWEDLSILDLTGFDLILACNSLHLSKVGIDEGIRKAFRSGARFVLLITEIMPSEDFFSYLGYRLIYFESYYVESSFAYHNLSELREHFSFLVGKPLAKGELNCIKRKLILERGHFWLKEKVNVKICLWRKRE